MKDKIAEALAKGKQRYDNKILAEQREKERIEREEEARIAADIPRAHRWIKEILPGLIEKEAEKYPKITGLEVSGAELDGKHVRREAIIRAANEIEGLRGYTTEVAWHDKDMGHCGWTNYNISWE